MDNMLEKFEKKWNIQFVAKNTVLISYPKSGRTWLRMILASVLYESGKDISKYEMLPAFHFSSDELLSRIGSDLNVIFLHRDPGDVVLSQYATMSNPNGTHIDFGTIVSLSLRKFIIGDINEIFNPDADYTKRQEWSHNFGLNNIIDWNNNWKLGLRYFNDFKVLTYEEMHDDAFRVIKDLLSWLKFDCHDEIIKEAIKHSEFENMRKIEHGYGKNNLEHYKSSFGAPGKQRVRQGKVKDYLNTLSEKDLKYVLEMKKRSLW